MSLYALNGTKEDLNRFNTALKKINKDILIKLIYNGNTVALYFISDLFPQDKEYFLSAVLEFPLLIVHTHNINLM